MAAIAHAKCLKACFAGYAGRIGSCTQRARGLPAPVYFRRALSARAVGRERQQHHQTNTAKMAHDPAYSRKEARAITTSLAMHDVLVITAKQHHG